MKNINEPVDHPGLTLGYEIFRRGLSVSEAARLLGLTRSLVAKITKGANPIMPSIAQRLELAGVGTAAEWLTAQAQYDIWRVRCSLNFDDVQLFPPPSVQVSSN